MERQSKEKVKATKENERVKKKGNKKENGRIWTAARFRRHYLCK